MTARGRPSTAFANLNEVLVKSHIFFPLKPGDEKLLSCIHVLCSSCSETISARTGQTLGDKIGCAQCAVCKLEFDTPSGKVPREIKDMKELLSELSLAANDCKWCEICRTKYPVSWSELNGQSALVYCTDDSMYKCLQCAPKSSSYRTIAMRSHLTQNQAKYCVEKWHKKRLEAFCIVCGKSSCLMCFVDNMSNQMKIDFEKQMNLDTELQSLNALTNELSGCKFKVEEQRTQFRSSLSVIKTRIEANFEEQMTAMKNREKLLLDQLRSIDSEVKQKFDRDINVIDALSTKTDSFKKSFRSIQSTGRLEEKFCAMGAVLEKIVELKSALSSLLESRLIPETSYESADSSKCFETSKIELRWIGDRSSDDKNNETEIDGRMYERAANTYKSANQMQFSTNRSENVTSTFYMHTKQDGDNVFSDDLADYRKTLQHIADHTIPNAIRTKPKKRISLLKSEDVDKLRQQFEHAKHSLPDKKGNKQWQDLERCHKELVSLGGSQAEGEHFTNGLQRMSLNIEEMMKQMTALGLQETRYQQGLSNFGNTCYFNAVIQCLCQTPLFLKGLSSRDISEQPLTEAFVRFWNYRSIGAQEEESVAFSEFFKQLFTSSPKFNNWRQHDSHDLFIHFLNDLRSEERYHITGRSQSSIDPKKVLTTVDKVFGGHFITAYACLECEKLYFVCECLLDISLPICIPWEQQSFMGEGAGRSKQLLRQQSRGSTMDRSQPLCRQTSYSGQGKELTQVLPKSLNDEKRIPENEDGIYRSRPIALTECLRFYTETEHIPEGYLCLSCQDVNQSAAAANASTMPAALKRTLIYNPPAILVLHLKRFERTATGFVKRSDRVSYEELLDLGPYCSSDCLRIDRKDKNVWYSLYGVVVHSGSLDCGHYVAYVKLREPNAKATQSFLQKEFLERDQVANEQSIKLANEGGKRTDKKVEWQPRQVTDGRWIYVSDSSTREATLRDALSQEAFMLFYERINA